MKALMKPISVAAALTLALISTTAAAQCQPIGWVKVGDRLISVTERQCVYEKSGARLQIIVSGFCPFNPC